MKKFTLFIACMLLGLFAATTFGQDKTVVFVFDSSGSMNDAMSSVSNSRLAVAKNALKNLVKELPDTTNLGIYTFRGELYPIGRLDKEAAFNAIDSLRRGSGSTPLYRTIKRTATDFLEFREKQNNHGTYKLVVVTDGAADRDDVPLNRPSRYPSGSVRPGVIDDVMNRGIIIDTIGLDMRGDHDLKNQINGSYMRGDDPNSLQQSLRKAVAEVSAADGADGFEVIAEFPVSFAYASVKGLTSYQNHPIGEEPPQPVIPQTSATPDQDSSYTSVSDTSSGVGTFLGIFAIIGLCVIGVIVALVVFGNR